jgi:hypothetical protein
MTNDQRRIDPNSSQDRLAALGVAIAMERS